MFEGHAVEDVESVAGGSLVGRDPPAAQRAARIERNAFRLLWEQAPAEHDAGELTLEVIDLDVRIGLGFLSDQEPSECRVGGDRLHDAQYAGTGGVPEGADRGAMDSRAVPPDVELPDAGAKLAVGRDGVLARFVVVRHVDGPGMRSVADPGHTVRAAKLRAPERA